MTWNTNETQYQGQINSRAYTDYLCFALVRESQMTMASKSSWSRSDVFLRKLQEQQNGDDNLFTNMDK